MNWEDAPIQKEEVVVHGEIPVKITSRPDYDSPTVFILECEYDDSWTEFIGAWASVEALKRDLAGLLRVKVINKNSCFTTHRLHQVKLPCGDWFAFDIGVYAFEAQLLGSKEKP